MSELVTLKEAAERVGRPHQWLRRELLKIERQTGQAILHRVGEGERRPTYRVNMGLLRVTCPTLFDVRDPLAEALKGSAVIGRHAIEQQKKRLDEISEQVSVIAEGMRKLAQRR